MRWTVFSRRGWAGSVPALALLFALGTASMVAAGQRPVSPAPAPLEPSPYRVRVGDVLEITFFGPAELNQNRTVGPDGEIQLTLIGPVKVVGRTVPDLVEELTERYRPEVVKPEITVNVSQFSGMKVYVGGEVNQAGMLPYHGGLTIVQAIMQAGGFKDTARLTQVVLIRKGEQGEPIGSMVNVKKVLHGADFKLDARLQPSDIVFVPRSSIADFNLFIRQFIQNNIPIPIVLGFNPFSSSNQ
jgi:polysaccharide biosynthesis/export protein PslD